MENKTIPKQIIDNIPQNLFCYPKTRNKLKIFYTDLQKIIIEKIKKKETIINIKKDLYILLKNSFSDIYQYFYLENNFQNLELFLFCLSNQLENKISKIVEDYNKMMNNQNKINETIENFIISFYDFFEDELVINYEDIINSILEANNTNMTKKNISEKQMKIKEEINNSFVLSLIKVINIINNISISKNEFVNIFTEGINGPNSNYFCLNDMGFLIIKIIEAIIKIKNIVSINKNNEFDKKFIRFIEISFNNIIPCLSEFFVKIILDYNLKHTFNIILKKEEFITLFTELSSIKIIRQRLLQILSITDKIFQPDKETQCKKIISKHKILDKIIIYISEDIKQKNYVNTKEILTEIKLVLIYYINNNISLSKFEENISDLFNNISQYFMKNDKNFSNSFSSFCLEIDTFNKSLPDESRFKIYNLMMSLFQISPLLSKSIFPVFINNFKDNIELYQDMIGKTNFFTSFVRNLYKYEPEMLNFFFILLTNLYNNFEYLPSVELTNLIDSIPLFTEVPNIKALVSGLRDFNNLINRRKKSYIIINQINQPKPQKDSKKNKSINNNIESDENNSDNLFEEINQNYIDKIMNVIKEILAQIKQNKMQNLFKPELLYFLFDYIQEIIKKDSIYKYFSSKNFPSFFDTLVSIPKYKPIAYKIIEVFLKSSIDKENNEAFIKLILNRYNSFSAEGVEEKEEKKIFFVEMNKIKELILMYRTLKITFINETLNEKSAIQNKLNNKIVEFILLYLDYINEMKENLYKVYNYQFHYYLKEYLEILFDLIIISNKNVINKQNEFSPKLNLENFEKIINKTLLFFKTYPTSNKNNLSINQSFNSSVNHENKNHKDNIFQNNNINKSSNNQINSKPSRNESVPIPGDTIINDDNNNNGNNNKFLNNNDNNNIDYPLDIIKYFIDKSMNIPYNKKHQDNLQNKKLHEYYIIKYKISKSIFSTDKPKNILSNFILQSPIIIISLLTHSYKLNFHVEKVLYIIYLLCITNENNIIYLLRQNILVILLNITNDLKKYNYIILKIINCCLKFLTKEELKQFFEHLIKMFNINNHTFTKDLLSSLNNNLNIIIGSDYEYTKGIILTNYLVKQPNIYNLININNINFSCDNNSTINIKQELYFYTTSNNNMKLVLLKLENEFFGENKNKQYLEITLYNYDISVIENDPQKDNNFILNTKDFLVLNDINVFNYIFNRNENRLSVSVNGKNIFSYEYSFDFPDSEGKKSSKNNNNNNNSIFITIGFPIEEVKEYNEPNFFIFQHIKLLSFNIKIADKNNEKNTIYKMKIDKIKLINKPYDNLTNFQLDDDTILISKYNSYETVKLNYIYYQNNLNVIFRKNIFFIKSYLSHALDYTFRLEKYLFILLNSLNLEKELFHSLINLLCTYFIINREYINCFLTKEEIISSIYFILYKNAKYIDKSIVEILFTSLLSYEKLNTSIVTDIFLDFQLFEKLDDNTKNELLNLVERKLLAIDDYNQEIILFQKLSYLLILCHNDSEKIKINSNNNTPNDTNNIKLVDETIIEIMTKLIFKNSNVEHFINKVIDLFYILFNFHIFVKAHITQLSKGRPKDTYQVILTFFKKMFINDDIVKIKNIFVRIFNNKINFDKFTKNKLINICQAYNHMNSNYSFYIKNTPNSDNKKQEIKRKTTLDKNNNNIDDDSKIKKSKILTQRTKSINITKTDDKNDDNISTNLKMSKRRKAFAEDNTLDKNNSVNDNDSFIVLGKINYVSIKINLSNKEQLTCDGDCQFCKFIKNIVLNLYRQEIKFNIFEKYMLNLYSESYLFNNNLEYNLNFSYYLMKKEGISRIRKNFELKVDKIANFEIDKSLEVTKNKPKKSDLEKLFSFYKNKKYSDNLINMFNLEQIFDVELVTECIEENDSFKNCYNCLLFEGLNYINSVMILSKNKIYILINVNVSDDLILYNVSTPIPRTFWIIDNYSPLLSSQCKYLQMFDEKNINDNMGPEDNNLFEKSKKGFQIYSFEYKEINELHKKRFLHQNNAIEIFLKNGKNYYLAFNVDLRDAIISKIIQYLIEEQNSRKKYLLVNNSNSDNIDDFNYTKEISNGSIGGNEIIPSSNINNDYCFEIANNSANSIKNENMIFMRNVNLFIEKERNIKQNSLKNIFFRNKAKKNYCKITDTKEILDQALEKWSDGFLNTYSYLMLLNTLSGRTYNNLAQYPIYPWILKDYFSTEIDLNESTTYRDLSYPIYAQDEETRKTLKMKYESFEDAEIKYHCGSHYSNSLFVCYYLIRVKPFSNISAEIQGNGFDTPDRLFFNIKKFYVVQEKYQELIPEIFNLPELYINVNNYIFGKTSENVLINNVELPPWALNSPRLFSKMNKKALESQYVSQHINDWIDLIFGFKRSGQEAEKSLNVLKDFFDHLDPKKEDEDMMEGKITELCEMGIDPIQLFNKAHPKRERHQINKAFFGRSVFMTFFEANESENYQIKNFHNSSKIKEIYSYYECKNGILSHGEGGLSSFRIIYENDTTFLKGKTNENKEGNIYFIVGEKKSLIPPSYKNFVEYGSNNIFNIVKPFKNMKYTFKIKHMKKSCINCIKVSSDGKHIVIGYDNGVIEKYKLKKVNDCFIEEVITVVNKVENTNDSNSIGKNQNNEGHNISGIKKIKSKGKSLIKNIFGFKKGKKKEINDVNNNNMQTPQSQNNSNNNEEIKTKMIVKNPKMFNKQLSKSASNILNSETILLNNTNNKFIQYNSVSSKINPNSNSKDNFEGYYYHSKNTSELKNLYKKAQSSSDNANKGYILFLINASYNILSGVYLIDICDSFSFMIVVDKMNKIYLYDFSSFKLLKYIDISNIFTNQIKFSNICPYTGDFIVSSSLNVVLMNINGLFLSQMNNIPSKINSCCISVIPMTESDLFLFTGHKDGSLIISKLIYNSGNMEQNSTKKSGDIINNLYHETYNNIEKKYRNYLDNNNLSLVFDIVIKIKCSENPIRFIKLTEDLTEIICIDNKNKIIYLNYEKYFVNRKENKNKKNLKVCPMCNAAISSSKIVCHLCGKKLCANCKIEKILPEYSFKNPKAICEDCLQIINSTNKMLYDF